MLDEQNPDQIPIIEPPKTTTFQDLKNNSIPIKLEGFIKTADSKNDNDKKSE